MKKNIIVYLVCVCVFYFLSNEKNAILFNEWKKKKKSTKWWTHRKKKLVFSIGLLILFTKRPLNNVTLKLKTNIVSFQNTCFYSYDSTKFLVGPSTVDNGFVNC